MTFDGAVIREQGVTFALVVVKSHIVQNRFEAGETISAFQPYFPGMPVVLVGQDSRGVPTYFRTTRHRPIHGQRSHERRTVEDLHGLTPGIHNFFQGGTSVSTLTRKENVFAG